MSLSPQWMAPRTPTHKPPPPAGDRESGVLRVEEDPRVERIQRALASDAFTMVFQPVVDLRRGVVAGAEALARFAIEPRRTPDVWFNEAWDVGLGIELELAAMRVALQSLSSLPEGAHIAINASPQTLVSPRLHAELASVPGHRIIVEMTEHARVEDYDAICQALKHLRSQGIRLAIDDAGAGFSSLQHILHLRPDLIKLDRSLTQAIDTDPVRYALAAALVTFAVSLDAQICAEGVEKETELVALQRLGIAYGQGYFLGRPAPLPLPAPPSGVWLFNSEPPVATEAPPVSMRGVPVHETLRPVPLSPAALPSPVVLDVHRLAALEDSELMDSPPEEAFDRFTRLASAVLDAPVALFSLVSSDRQFFKSATGLGEPETMLRETPLSHSLCQHVVTMNSPLVVNDARRHPLVRDNLAVSTLNVSSYAGVPVCGPDGKAIGALAVLDYVPRAWTSEHIQVLRDLASAVMSELAVRRLEKRKLA